MSCEKILTISIAAYNMEAYLDEALQSLNDPDFIHLLDVIIVNDGSTDRTSDIASKYVSEYPDSFTLINKDNGGYGSTINCSLKLAKGKYIKLLDADDWFETANMKSFLSLLEKTNIDMVLTQYSCYNCDSSHLIDVKQLPYTSNVQLDVSNLSDIMMHALTVRTEVVRNITITEHCFYTDVEWFIKAALNCDTMIAFPINIYCYRLGREGQSISDIGFITHKAEDEYVARYAAITIKNNICLSGLKKPTSYIVSRVYMSYLKSKRTLNNIKSLFSYRRFIANNADYCVQYFNPFSRCVYKYWGLMLFSYNTLEKMRKVYVRLRDLRK